MPLSSTLPKGDKSGGKSRYYVKEVLEINQISARPGPSPGGDSDVLVIGPVAASPDLAIPACPQTPDTCETRDRKPFPLD